MHMLCSREKEVAKATQSKTITIYKDESGNEPFSQWLGSLTDTKGRLRIMKRIDRLENGNYGDCEPIGDGLSELRMFFGPGYRAYFGEKEGKIIILLCGGDKDTQSRDIKAAKEYWRKVNSHG